MNFKNNCQSRERDHAKNRKYSSTFKEQIPLCSNCSVLSLDFFKVWYTLKYNLSNQRCRSMVEPSFREAKLLYFVEELHQTSTKDE